MSTTVTKEEPGQVELPDGEDGDAWHAVGKGEGVDGKRQRAVGKNPERVASCYL
jgi:hypothetical protein